MKNEFRIKKILIGKSRFECNGMEVMMDVELSVEHGQQNSRMNISVRMFDYP